MSATVAKGATRFLHVDYKKLSAGLLFKETQYALT